MSTKPMHLKKWYKSPVGHMVRRCVQSCVDFTWADTSSQSILCMGYTKPYSKLWERNAKVEYAIPDFLPLEKSAQKLKTHALPYDANKFDKIFICHALEFFAEPEELLKECKRVLKSDGELLIMVPNRAGAWCRVEISPLASGQPYSAWQLSQQLTHAGFTAVDLHYAVYSPPSSNALLLRWSGFFEKYGRLCKAPVGGVVLITAKKDILSGTLLPSKINIVKGLLQKPAGAMNISNNMDA